MGPIGRHPSTGELFQQPLAELINLTHPLLKLVKTLGIRLRQNYNREALRLAIKARRYAHARQFRRMKAALKSGSTTKCRYP